MSRIILNPHTNASLDYDSVPVYDVASGKMGRLCPNTRMPLDRKAIENFHYCYGTDEANNRLKNLHNEAVSNVENQLSALETSSA